jgi:hypothetical protein
MIQLEEKELAKLMFDIWQNSNDLKNPVMVSNYIDNEIIKVKNLALSGVVKSYCEHKAKLLTKKEVEANRSNAYKYLKL